MLRDGRRVSLVMPCVLALSVALAAQGKPPETQKLLVNDAELSYTEQGRGAPVVFVHGAVGDLRFWEPQRDTFSKRYRFISYSYRYHGTAPWPDEGKQYSAETHAADLVAFISGLKAGPVHLVGLSYGGLLGAIVATRHPELIRSLTLAEPALFSLLAETPEGKPALEEWMKNSAPMRAAVEEGDSLNATKMLVAVVNGQPVESFDFDKVPAGLRQLLLDNARTLPLLFNAPLAAVSCDELRTIKAPTLLVRGARTPQFFVKINELAGRCIGGSRQVAVPDAAHAMSWDNPAAFNRAVLQFFGQQSELTGQGR
jgi:pimeloyl-ACP methyl ester carboxylesterase